MIYRVRDMLKFRVERALIRGPLSRLLVIGIAIVLVSVIAGLLVYFGAKGFKTASEAVWWAFLRLSDPGYLGDDHGTFKRTISTIVTILGYVLFMGSLIAIMTQWLTQTLRNLERGFTPIVAKDHLVILGWSNRTPAVIQELLSSTGRVRRFLQLRGARRLQVAVLAEEVTAELVNDLAERLGPLWNRRQIILRSGSPLRLEHLRRVGFASAAAILLPGREAGAGEPVDADTEAIKTLLTITNAIDADGDGAPPLVVAEIHDAREIPLARRLYHGPVEIIASSQLIGRLMAQALRYPGLSHVYRELLQHDDTNELYVRAPEELTGRHLSQLFEAFPRAIPIGLVRQGEHGWEPHLGLAEDATVEDGDRLVLVAPSYEETAPSGRPAPEPIAAAAPERPTGDRPPRRILVLGWNQRVPALLAELEGHADQRFAVTVASLVPAAQRDAGLDAYDLSPNRVTIEHHELDGTNLSHLRRLDPGSFHHVVLVASERAESEAESDARTILSYLLLRELVPADAESPKVVVELVDPGNAELFETRASEVMVSPLILSHMVAQVALRRELRCVFDELIGAGGAEISFRRAVALGLSSTITFRELQKSLLPDGAITLGVRRHRAGLPRGGVTLNPPRTEPLQFTDDDEIIVVTREG